MTPPMIPRKLPIVQIQQQYAKIGIDADLGQQSLRQPRPTFEMRQIPAKLDIRQPRGDLIIDQSKAWDALGLANNLEVMNKIYSQAREIALQGIARIVENGNRMAMIHIDADPIPEIAEQIRFTFSEYDFAGPASVDNVDITYQANKPQIEVQDGYIDLQTQVNPVEHVYTRGKLDIYVRQRESIKLTPPVIDTAI